MNDGFLRVMTKTTKVKIADVAFNKDSILAAIDEAAEKKAKVLVLPELCLTSCSCEDLFLQKTLLVAAENAALEIGRYTLDKDIAVVFSMPVRKDGNLYVCSVVAAGGELLGFVPKSFLPSSQCRTFVPAFEGNDTVSFMGEEYPFGNRLLFQCEDEPLLTIAAESGEDLSVSCPVSSSHALAGATVIACPDAGAEIIGAADLRRNHILAQSTRGNCAYLYVSCGEGESTSSCVYSSHNVIAEGGYILAEAEPFGCATAIADIDLEVIDRERRKNGVKREIVTGYDTIYFSLALGENDEILRHISKTPFVNEDEKKARQACLLAQEIQARALATRLEKTGIKKTLLGISGGLDSTMALLAAVRTYDMLGRDRKDIIAVTMPCFGTSGRTKSNAEKMCELLGVDFRTVDISDTVRKHLADIGHDGFTTDTTFENAQARERTQVLMDLANMENGLVLGTGDLSEESLGWCTFNGDHISMYNVNCDLPKTFLRAAVYYYGLDCGNEALRVVLHDVVDTPVSPELTPPKEGEIAQKTEDILGPYEAHDFFLFHFIRNGSGPRKILRLARQAFAGVYTDEELDRWIRTFFRRFFNNQFKRNCAPDGPRVGSVDLSASGWKMTSDVSATEFLRELDE